MVVVLVVVVVVVVVMVIVVVVLVVMVVVAESGCMAWGAYMSLSPQWALTTCGSSDERWGWA